MSLEQKIMADLKTAMLAKDEKSLRGFRRSHDITREHGVARERFFADHVFAGLQGRDRLRGVQWRWHAEVHQFDGGIG